MKPKMTLREWVRQSESRLREGGCGDAGFDAAQLTAEAAGISPNRLMLQGGEPLSDEGIKRLEGYLTERLSGRPLQYILGCWEFYGLPFYVGEGVLIPRPDTEVLVDAALTFIRKTGAKTVIDLCSGSGCIGIAVAKWADVTVTAIEKFSLAMDFTVRNIGLNGVYNVTARSGDLFAGPGEMTCELLLSNPPYIPDRDMATLQKEVRFEPETALNGGTDGLDYYRAICEKWVDCVTPGGGVMVEVGIHQADDVAELFRAAGLQNVEKIRDLSGIERVVSGRKPMG